MLQIVIIAVLFVALSPLVYYLLSLYCVIGYFRPRDATAQKASFMPPASIIKPVRGLDHEAYENFASFCRLDYPEYEVLFAVSEGDDRVCAVIEKLRADFPACTIRLITNIPRIGTNDKVNNLCALVQNAKYDFLVMSDSDVRVEPDYLKQVIAPFADPEVGAVTAFYKSLSAGDFASNLDALSIYMDSAPSALVAKKIEGKMRFAFGWTMATSKGRLAEIGGWEEMANYHSDDFELGKRIAECGHRVELMTTPVTMVFPGETLREHLRHELRWAIGLRSVRPLGYWGLVFTHGLPWALVGAATAMSVGSLALAVLYIVAYLVLRVGLTWLTGRWGMRDRQLGKILWLVPVRDAINFIIWIAGFFSDKIIWRGLAYHVRSGQLIPIQSSSLGPAPSPETISPVAN
ncbi:MAG TPA: bacteriohopanetetrol glucosamine biosynthesis glycosyltransferase HpnI [Candidatus Acidoferrum sp.]|nr:bacteriohopanetetrol glucosamine biosynthesis glycosyltransferase HpnI [Candidatus Acidoferrum sp.]